MELHRPRVILDSDGLLSDFSGGFLQALFEITQIRVDPNEVDQYEIAECEFFLNIAQRVSIDVKRLKALVVERVCSEKFCEQLEVLPDSKKSVEIINKNSELFVVTSPWDSSPFWMYERHHWLMKHYGLKRHQIIQAGAKHAIHANIFADDKLSNVARWQKEWPKEKAILFAAPHNRTVDYPLKGGWPEIMEILQQHS